ncbi:SHOCT domain-containing protein [Nonomuraea sp. NBC_01738]|uniref:SHOCT domain-containing protein n=1 Tax=Nonomuraea sp. NBC_01738 TaxID=2976003 RepID=UPI002E118622|nr:SHOCT domain-containing protein [Nonomuraea sp. NBC_01738]
MDSAPWNHMWDYGGGWMIGGLMMVAWLGLIAMVIWLVVRSVASTSQTPGAPRDRARELLAERYARGEISTEEYQDRLAHLP